MQVEARIEEYFRANRGNQIDTLFKEYLLEQKQYHQDHLINEAGEVSARWRQGRIQQLNDMLNLISKVRS